MDDASVPTSRARRTAILGRLVAGQAARTAGAKISTVGRTDDRKQEVMERRVAEAITALVDALGLMRGAAMKVGQMLSMVEMGVIPDEYRDEFQRAMSQLRDAAPTVSFKQMRAVIEADLGQKLEEAFASFDPQPIGAASIGQVYRARLHDGRDVAVKVQYPGVDKAVRADLKNLGLIMKAARMIAPEMDLSGLTEEIRERISEELDYELEAQNQRAAARLYRGHPFIVVPDVVSSLCGQHVLVTEFFEGKGFEELKDEPQELRDRVGEIIYRFFGGSLYAHAQFSPDPHPGNFLVGADGKVAFLDFGLYRHLDSEAMTVQTSIMRSILEGDEVTLHRVLRSSGFMPTADEVTPDLAMRYVRELFWWMATDESLAFDQQQVTSSMNQLAHPSSEYFELARRQNMPPDYLFVVRMIIMVMAAVSELGSNVNWYRVAREWLYGDAPASELGLLEAQYREGGVVPQVSA